VFLGVIVTVTAWVVAAPLESGSRWDR
jgi:hypothetical protein